MERFEGRAALVTGGARGIGAAIARMFAAQGAAVVVADILDDEGKALAGEFGDAVRYVHLDVTSADGWLAAVAEIERAYGPVAVLVNNAGIVEYGTIERQAPESFRRVVDVNLYGAWLGMHTAAPSLRRAGGGVIVNISSTAGLVGYANIGAYTASKWGLRGLTKTAALELAGDGIRVCSVHPGAVRTPMIAGFDAAAFTAEQPIARVAEPDEVARMVAFIVAEATYSTGSEFILDGGATVGTSLTPSAR